MIDFIPQRHDLLRHFGDIAVIVAQIEAQVGDGLVAVRLGNAINQVQGVIQKVGVDLHLQLFQLGFLGAILLLIHLACQLFDVLHHIVELGVNIVVIRAVRGGDAVAPVAACLAHGVENIVDGPHDVHPVIQQIRRHQAEGQQRAQDHGGEGGDQGVGEGIQVQRIGVEALEGFQ